MKTKLTAYSFRPLYLATATAVLYLTGLASSHAAEYALFTGAAPKFIKDAGTGSFTMGEEGGKKIGIFRYDFSGETEGTKGALIAKFSTPISEGTKTVTFSARSAAPVRLTLRLVDSTGQKHQYRALVKGTGSWEPITLDLTKKVEAFGGAADKEKHFPIKEFVISIPVQAASKTGKVEFADASLQ
jgi:hypothetical protein